MPHDYGPRDPKGHETLPTGAAEARADALAAGAARRARRRAQSGGSLSALQEGCAGRPSPLLTPLEPRDVPPALHALVLEESEWTRAALQAASRIGQAATPPFAGAVAWCLEPDRLIAFVRDAASLPAPFVAVGSQGATGLSTWSLERLPAETTGSVPPASLRAALVTLWERDGLRTLIDLVKVSSLAIDGPPVAVGAAFTDALLELVTRRWSDVEEVVLVGFGTVCERLGDVHRVDDVLAARRLLEASSPGTGRCIVVAPGLPHSGERTMLASLIAVVEQLPGTCLLCCDSSAPVRAVWHFAGRGEAQNVELRHRGSVVATIASPAPGAEQPAPGGQDFTLAGKPEHRRSRLGVVRPVRPVRPHHSAVWIGVLGPVRVTGTTADLSRRRVATELLVYLALHPEGAFGEGIAGALWPERRVTPQTLSNRLHEVRRVLGVTPQGRSRLTKETGRHVLAPDIHCDWTDFQALTEDGTDIDDWRRALSLVRGRPLEGLARGDWAVLEGFAAAIEAAILDTAVGLSESLLKGGDFLGAEWAARRGLVVAPWDERLYRQLMRAADLAGNRRGVDAALKALALALEIPGDPLRGVHPATAALYQRLVEQFDVSTRRFERPVS